LTESDIAAIDLTGEEPVAGPVKGTRAARLSVLLGVCLVLVLLAGIGAVVGWRLLSAGARPADNLPASLAAYAGVDLAPAPDQEARLLELARRLPRSGTTSDGRSFDPAKLIDGAIGHHPGIDVRRDLTSWLGVRFGVGAWLDRHSRPYVLIAAASRDDNAARAGLRRLHDAVTDADLGYLVSDHLVLLAVGNRDAQAAVEAARAEASAHPLAKAAGFLDATRWLGEPQVVLAWMDNARYRDFTAAQLAQENSPLSGVDSQAGPTTGQVIFGVRATGDGLTARFRSSGGDAVGTPVPDALSRLGALPGDSAVAAVARIPAHLAGATANVLDPVGAAFGLLLRGMVTFGEPAATLPGQHQLSAAEQQQLDALLSKDPTTLTRDEHKRIEALLGFDPTTLGAPMNKPTPVLTDAEQQEVQALLDKDPGQLTAADRARLTQLLGFDPTDMGHGPDPTSGPTDAIAGAAITLAVSGLTGTPTLKAIVEATSAEQAHRLASSFGSRLTITSNGTTVTGTSPGYTDSGGRLADRPLFQKAVAGSPANVYAAVFVDLHRAVPQAQRDKLGGLLAVSLIVGQDHGDAVGIVRLMV
jgi:hypothetical protein